MLQGRNAVFMYDFPVFGGSSPPGNRKDMAVKNIFYGKNIEIRCMYFSFSLNGLFLYKSVQFLSADFLIFGKYYF